MRIPGLTALIVGAALAAPLMAPALAPSLAPNGMAAQAAIACAAPTGAEIATITDNINHQRQGNGLSPVRLHPALAQAAATQACDMARRGQMTHAGRGGIGARVRAAGYSASVTAENIAAGQMDATSAIRAWIRSPSHRANILNRRVRDIGIAQAVGADGRTRYWSLVLAAPR